MTTSHLKPPSFDIFGPLLGGTTLIEASAGTGKTYTISRIVLRLIVEEKYDVTKILVVTFTEAATQELRKRIRSLIAETLYAFSKGTSDDPFLSTLLSRNNQTTAIPLLQGALHRFDDVSIYTIHGFCERILRENAFESGQTFNTELITNQDDLLNEITEDFWRTHFYNASPFFIAYAISKKYSPKAFRSLISSQILSGSFTIAPDNVLFISCVEKEKSFSMVAQYLQKIWFDNKDEFVAILNSPNLNKVKYSIKIVAKLCRDTEMFLSQEPFNPDLACKLEKLSSTILQNAVKKGYSISLPTFFTEWENLVSIATNLCTAYENNLLYVHNAYFKYISLELDTRKRIHNVLYFDDLLLRVGQALLNPVSKTSFIKSVQSQFAAVLIDEFQDTDPLQYAIFHTLFSNVCKLFFIGDPKQAIFSFRGADIFAYIAASKKTTQAYTLTTNYRSSPNLINAVNSLFTIAQNPFVYNEIVYHPVDSSPLTEHTNLVLDNVPSPAFNILLFDKNEAIELTTTANAKIEIIKTVANECARILNLAAHGKAFLQAGIKSKPLLPSDIAIIVRTHSEAFTIQDELFLHDVHSVVDSDASVFDSLESIDLYRVCQSIHDPSNLAYMKAALSTKLFGVSASDILLLETNDESLNNWTSKFFGYHETWRKNGIMLLLQTFFTLDNVKQRVLALPRGERALTNILHISELLHKQEKSSSLTMSGLIRWFMKKNQNAQDVAADDEIIRLESDENAIRIVTIHKCKGLEYPVVFCPFTTMPSQVSSKNKNKPFVFHNPLKNNETTFAIGKDEIDNKRIFMERELLAENLRLLYVALTRAKVCCYFVWGAIPNAETSAPAYLLHGVDNSESAVLSLYQTMKTLPFAALKSRITTLQGMAPEAIHIEKISVLAPHIVVQEIQTSEQVLLCKYFEGAIASDWHVASFTGLSYHRFPDDSYRNMIESRPLLKPKPLVDITESSTDIFHFPKGARAGVFFHEVLENVNFETMDESEIADIVTTSLQRYEFDPVFLPAVCTMIDHVAWAELCNHQSKPVRLRGLPRTKCLREIGFYFPLQKIAPHDLYSLFSHSNTCKSYADILHEQSPDRLTFSPTQGFLKGFIDCIFEIDNRFYLIDWKSNFCGATLEDYKTESLQKIMTQEHYILQYHLYLVALHTYLSQRLRNYDYDIHFGNVLYVFLRGIDKNKGSNTGIYCDRPQKEFIEELCGRLINANSL